MLFELLRRLDKGEFAPRIVSLKGREEYGERLERLGLRVDCLGAGGLPGPRELASLCRIIGEARPKIIHAWLYKSIQLSRLAGLRRKSLAIISSPRTNYRIFSKPYRLADRWLKSLDRLAIAESQATADYLTGPQGYCPEKVRVIRNGVDLDHWKFSPQARQQKRQELGLGPQDLAGLAVGRIDRNKSYKLILEAMARLDRLKVFLAGAGPEEESLRRLARESGLADRFVMLGRRRDVSQLMSAADLFIHPSLVEGLPNVILEASAVSRPVVAAASDGTREAVAHGQSGLLVPPGDVGALTEAIRQLAGNDDLRERLGRGGRALMEAEFGMDAVVQKYRRAYLDILEEDRR